MFRFVKNRQFAYLLWRETKQLFHVNVQYAIVRYQSDKMNGCSADKFYGYPAIIKKKSVFKPSWIKVSRRMPSHILGPPNFWKEFSKQAEALVTAFEESNDSDVFCTFVYQGDNGYRKFVVAHPEMYWWHYEHRPAEKRCSYEVRFLQHRFLVFNGKQLDNI